MRWMRVVSLLAVGVTLTLANQETRPRPPHSSGQTCTVYAHGQNQDDVPQILEAFWACNNGGRVVFPAGQNYYIAQKLNPVLSNVEIDWMGVWTMSDDLDYWRNNSYPIAFQNHHAGFVISGHHIYINGHNIGGINGNGNVWYDVEQRVTQPGRPMPFVFWNVSEVFVEHFSVIDPPLWSINIMNGTNIWFDDIYVNATAVNAPYGTNWVQNTDGFDTMDAEAVKLTNMVYQGGDDCIAIKPRSYNIYMQNITCNGGNGVAIGSLGQYLEDSSVGNIIIKDVNVLRHNNDLETSAYIKTWVGVLVNQSSYESDYQPRGGGWGTVQNIRFENFYSEGAGAGPHIDQASGNNGSFLDSSLMEISNIAFINFTGSVDSSSTAYVRCATPHPCFNIAMRNISLVSTASGGLPEGANGTCAYIAPNGVSGMTGPGC